MHSVEIADFEEALIDANSIVCSCGIVHHRIQLWFYAFSSVGGINDEICIARAKATNEIQNMSLSTKIELSVLEETNVINMCT